MISEAKKKIVIENYFKSECDVNTSIKDAFIKGFELGLRKAPKEPRWITLSEKWPEDCQEVFVTTDEGDIVTDVFHVDSGGYYFEDRDVEYVTAWMPLFIKPYKEESEDKEYEENNNIKYRRH